MVIEEMTEGALSVAALGYQTGKGMMKELKRVYTGANILAIDYDPGASEVNQLNRIKLMISTVFGNIEEFKQIK